MEKINKDGQEVHETPEQETANSENAGDETPNEEELTPEQIAELKRNADASSQNFARAKKAEEEVKTLKQQLESYNKENKGDDTALSPKDYLALTENKVSSDDFDEVLRVSKILGKNVSETLKDDTMKTILDKRAEERRTASATQTRGGSRGASKTSGEDFLQKAERTGEVPDGDDEMRKLAEARLERKRQHAS